MNERLTLGMLNLASIPPELLAEYGFTTVVSLTGSLEVAKEKLEDGEIDALVGVAQNREVAAYSRECDVTETAFTVYDSLEDASKEDWTCRHPDEDTTRIHFSVGRKGCRGGLQAYRLMREFRFYALNPRSL